MRSNKEIVNAILNGGYALNNPRLKRLHRIFRIAITVLIMINIVVIFFSSYSEFKLYLYYLTTTIFLSLILFTAEFLLRIYCAPVTFPAKRVWFSRIRYLTSLFGIIDILSISPFLGPVLMLLISNDIDFAGDEVKIINFIRVILFIKLFRYSRSFHFMLDVMNSVKKELWVGISISLILIVSSGTIMFYIENPAQPDVFYDVGQGFWWSIISFATVGYGDIVPITPAGKIVASLIAFIGIGTIAIPAGIISSAFLRKMNESKVAPSGGSPIAEVSQKEINVSADKKCYCPYCGSKLNR